MPIVYSYRRFNLKGFFMSMILTNYEGVYKRKAAKKRNPATGDIDVCYYYTLKTPDGKKKWGEGRLRVGGR